MPNAPPAACPAAWAALPGRSALLVRGPDAVRFVDNFTTASIARLAPGAGTEGFFTDARGHVLAIVNILRTVDGVWLDAAAGVATRLHPHLARYHIREDLEFIDASAERGTLLLAGPGAADWLAARIDGTLPTALLTHAERRLAGETAAVLALDWFGPGGFLVQAPAAAAERLAASFRSVGLAELAPATIDAARIAAGSPEPADIDDRTLPQELGRDDRAISFTKGCYLGQETVARIDALGHVNRRFVVLATASPPAVGTTVTAAGETVGRITSACANPAGGLGLALVHVRGLTGATLEIDGVLARVVTGGAARQEA